MGHDRALSPAAPADGSIAEPGASPLTGSFRALWYVAFVAMRLLVLAFFLLTSTYSLLNYSPFVFHQFIRPRIFGWVNQFVSTHHLWYLAAYAATIVTLAPELLPWMFKSPHSGMNRRLAVAYVVCFGLVGEWLVVTPYLPTLWNDRRSFVAAVLSFAPIVWLAAIDHVSSWRASFPEARAADGDRPRPPLSEAAASAIEAIAAIETRVTDQRRTLAACVLTAVYLWLTHLAVVWASARPFPGVSLFAFTAGWALLLDLVAAIAGYTVLNVAAGCALATRRPRTTEYGLDVVLAALAIAVLLLKVPFAAIEFGTWQPVLLAVVAGLALALAWSGLALRRASRIPERSGALDVLLSPIASSRHVWMPGLALACLPFATFGLLSQVARADWNFLVQKTIGVVEWLIAFALVFRLTRAVPPTRWSFARAGAPAVIAAVLLMAAGRLSHELPRWSGAFENGDVALDEYAGRDVSFSLLYDAFVEHPGRDAGFSRYLQMNSSVPTSLTLPAPDVEFSPGGPVPGGPHPHIFLFVVDSLRRDYLSPFNPAVTFSPSIASFAADSFPFQNAFTHYGGTALAVPSIWSGSLLLHRLYMPDFQRMNALEKLLDSGGYRWYMSLDTITGPLISPHPDLVQLDRDREVMQFDFCRTLKELQAQMNARTGPQPVFAFTLPQNLHISNRQHGAVPPGEHYPGFFEPYAAEVRRIDHCFGEFIGYLKAAGLYEDSIIVLTTDHGDSLGEAGNWGHGVTIYPEVVRIPLLIHVPARLKASVGTDLTRIAFSTDIVPTLYELLEYHVRDLGPLFGSPLFAPADRTLVPRQDGSFLLASSYAATWGLLRHNGRSLYIADLVNGRELAYDLTPQPIGRRIRVTDAMREINRSLMREEIGALGALFQFTPEP
jgi:hypothetical protein